MASRWAKYSNTELFAVKSQIADLEALLRPFLPSSLPALPETADQELGVLKHLPPGKNFGFIASSGAGGDLFFHANDLRQVRFDTLTEGDYLQFRRHADVGGRPKAIEVQL